MPAERIDYENLNVPFDLDLWPLENQLRWYSGVFGHTGGRRLSACLEQAATELVLVKVPGDNYNLPRNDPAGGQQHA